MIKEFVERWEAKKGEIEAQFNTHPANYEAIVKIVLEAVTDPNEDEYSPDPANIHTIDDGDYQGTLLFVIPQKGYQPSTYYTVFVDYGSCSGCDTLESIHGYGSETATDEQRSDYMTLALGIVQGLKRIGYAERES